MVHEFLNESWWNVYNDAGQPVAQIKVDGYNEGYYSFNAVRCKTPADIDLP